MNEKEIKTIIEENKIKKAKIVYKNFLNFLIIPGVYKPSIESDLLLKSYFENIKTNFRKKKILDYGTGNGFLSINIAANEATEKIVATDINPLAIACAKINSRYNKVQELIDFRLGNEFNTIKKGEHFDIILASLPYHKGIPNNWHEYSFLDNNLIMRKTLFKEGENYLSKKGKILFTYNYKVNEDEPLEPILKKYHWKYKLLNERDNYFVLEIMKIAAPSLSPT